ncbi:acyl-CoA-binding domain-containing protein 5-like [Liolophura sinensis]|uniref:acyl-CoA-binding domain-containing protein 5-like n=1 Tax=Liolophura sinensis TaxID=3198878 RepID=UPI0031583D3E
MAASTREKFDAAVNVIKSLPKNGSFQPSQELMLLFYGYYKQSTEGPCNLPKPSFWEVVKKAKWDAWSKLGEMSREEAMMSYVEELKKIIETMPQTQMVAEFMETLGTFYELVEEKPLYNGNGRNSDDEEDEQLGNHNDVRNFSRDLSLQLATVEEELRSEGLDPDRDVAETDLIHIPVKSHIAQPSDFNTGQSVRINGDVHLSENGQVNANGDDSSKDNTHSESTSKEASESTSKETSEDTSKETSQSTEQDDSESEGEEFCDSTDQIQVTSNQVPAREPLIAGSCSTPLKAPRISEGFNRRNRLPMSPIGFSQSGRLTSSYLPFSPAVPRLSHLRQAQLSDSLAVNTPGDESLNTDLSQMLSLTQPDRSSLEDPPQTMETESRLGYITSRGGGDITMGHRAGYHLSRQGTAPGLDGTGYSSSDMSSSRRGLFRQPGAGGGGGSDDNWQTPLRADLSEQIALALLRLQQDMNSVIARLDSLERASQQRNRQTMWWPFPNLSGKSVFFMLVWPFVVHWLLNAIKQRRRYDR